MTVWDGTTFLSYSLNSSKGDTYGIIYETVLGVLKGDTRSLDNGSHRDL